MQALNQSWDPLFAQRNGVFGDLNILLDVRHYDTFPMSCQLNRMFAASIEADCGQGFQFVDDQQLSASSDHYYEEFVGLHHAIPTRAQNWHDFFGALIWWLFPRTKCELNRQHMVDIHAHGLKRRTPRRDRITHFDECGIVVACCDPRWIELLRDHQWHEVLWQYRSLWGESIRAYPFGHALYELALEPFIGLTGKMYPLYVEADHFSLPLKAQYRALDHLLAEQLQELDPLSRRKTLSPLPLLGIPHWYMSQDELFYQNRDYFRPKRHAGEK